MDILSIIVFIINAVTLVRFITSIVMCVYGYKWKRGLIATTSIYIGVFLGALLLYCLGKIDIINIETSLILSLFVPIIFFILAYRWIRLNHFLIGFITSTKILFMLLYGLMDKNIIDIDASILFVVPLIIGVIVGCVLSTYLKYSAVLLCLAYIGSVDLVLNLFDLINKGLFIASGDISYIFDIEDILMQIIGIDIPSFWESVFILAVTIFSFIWQSSVLRKRGVNLSDYIIDDRKKDLIE